MSKYFVVKEIGSDDSKPFMVVRHGQAFEGRWSRKCLWVEMWHSTEDAARAHAHSLLFPEYDG